MCTKPVTSKTNYYKINVLLKNQNRRLARHIQSLISITCNTFEAVLFWLQWDFINILNALFLMVLVLVYYNNPDLEFTSK